LNFFLLFNYNKNIMKRVLNLLVLFCLVPGMILINGCKDDPVLPVITTAEVTGVSINAAISGGDITSDGGGEIIERGVCLGTTPEPTITDTKIVSGSGPGEFTSNLTGLLSGTTYFVRAFATNEAGTAYGEEFSFNTKIADADGNQYNIVFIGSQVWMAENLKTTTYNDIDHTTVPNVTSGTAWAALLTPGYAWYNNDESYNKPVYGAIYNWYAVVGGNLCPTGWHVPTDADFNTLEIGLGLPSAQVDVWGWRGTDHGSKLKSTTGWNAGENGTNSSGFSALPGGYRYYSDGAFYNQGTLGYWWSATEHDAPRAWYRRMDGSNSAVYKASAEKKAGKYIRCVKD
jgi:uncharacterized protein (TIGR02145 family)